MQPNSDNYKVTLRSAADGADMSIAAALKKFVTFQVTPDLTESRTVNYTPVSPIHAPGQFFMYTNTQSRTYSLSNVKLVSRTRKEARDNLQSLNILRAWTMPYFGTTAASNIYDPFQTTQETLNKRLGAPPEVLLLSAYSNSIGSADSSFTGNVNRVPVVITSLTIPYSSETDYIPTQSRGNDDTLGGVPFPAIIVLDIQLAETHSPYEYSRFSLAKYQSGNLDSF
jgi:hypothetical protein